MSAWKGRDIPLEPIAGAIIQLSHLAAGSIATACDPAPFTESLQQLQALHDQQVAVLAGEVTRLRGEVWALRGEVLRWKAREARETVGDVTEASESRELKQASAVDLVECSLPVPYPDSSIPVREAKAVDFVAASCRDAVYDARDPPKSPLTPRSMLLAVPQAAEGVAAQDAREPPKSSPRSALRRHTRGRRAADGAEQDISLAVSKQTWVGTSISEVAPVIAEDRGPSKSSNQSSSVKTLSEAVSRSVTHQLQQIKSERTQFQSEDSVSAMKSLSESVSKTVTQRLLQMKSEHQPMAMARTGSMLLDEYETYKENLTPGDTTGFAKKLVSSPKFDLCMGAIIMMNAVTIGLEASINRAGDKVPLALEVLEYIFLAVYTIEICLRLTALRFRALCSAWVQFDLLLVCCGFLDLATSSFGASVKILDNVMLVRTFRLARLARVLRLMIKFHTLWMLVQGLLNSLLTLTWTCIIICILLFVFAVLGLELLQPDDSAGEEYNRVASDNFGSLLRATTSLLQGLTLDSFADIYRPVMLAKPLTVFYFVPFLLVVSISLMNLVTALMVNFSLEQATKDRQAEEQQQQKQKAEVARILEAAFGELDTENSGKIDLKQMLAAPEELRMLICQVADMGCGDSDADLSAVFSTLDFDKSGYLKIEDFCQGLMMLHDHKALESYFVTRNFASLMKTIRPRRSSRESNDMIDHLGAG